MRTAPPSPSCSLVVLASGNKALSEAAIKEEIGAETVVEHKVGYPFTVVVEVGGTKGVREGPCPPPMYYNNCAACGCTCCGGHEVTAKNAAAIGAGGAPHSNTILR